VGSAIRGHLQRVSGTLDSRPVRAVTSIRQTG
jgi:hypothetical protein